MNETLLKKLAKPMLILAPVIWGSSFVVMKHSLDSFTPFYLLAFRFTAAAVLLGLACWKSWRASTPKDSRPRNNARLQNKRNLT